jgi:terminase small subunit-like protein
MSTKQAKPKAKPAKAAGRKRVEYGPVVAEQILDHIIDGKTLAEIEKIEGMPSRSSILKWRRQHKEFGEGYAEAMDLRADADADAVDDIGRRMLRGEVDCNTGRAVIDALKWAASHRAPRRYGTKVSSEITGKDGAPITIASDHDQIETARRVALLLGMGMARLEAGKLIEGERNE